MHWMIVNDYYTQRSQNRKTKLQNLKNKLTYCHVFQVCRKILFSEDSTSNKVVDLNCGRSCETAAKTWTFLVSQTIKYKTK